MSWILVGFLCYLPIYERPYNLSPTRPLCRTLRAAQPRASVLEQREDYGSADSNQMAKNVVKVRQLQDLSPGLHSQCCLWQQALVVWKPGMFKSDWVNDVIEDKQAVSLKGSHVCFFLQWSLYGALVDHEVPTTWITISNTLSHSPLAQIRKNFDRWDFVTCEEGPVASALDSESDDTHEAWPDDQRLFSSWAPLKTQTASMTYWLTVFDHWCSPKLPSQEQQLRNPVQTFGP